MAASNAANYKWIAGLINADGKYLTAEKFQFKVSVNGPSLRKKQTWTLESVSDTEIAIKSCFNRYLASNKDGVISADSEEIEADNKFELVYQADGAACIKTAHGRYFGGKGDNLSGFDTGVTSNNKWKIHLALMPQLNLRSVIRKAYAHLQNDEICCNEQVPWGNDATISIDYHDDGRYSIRASNGFYLNASGGLQKNLNEDCLYVLAFKASQVAFRAYNGKYLAAVGPNATLQARKPNIGKDELFTFEDTNPQFTLLASNKKYCSVLQGTDIRANQMDVRDTEIFQMQAVDRSDFSGNVKWAISSKEQKFWIMNNLNAIECTAVDFKSSDAQFTIEWEGTMIRLVANNGKYVAVKSGGGLAATCGEKNEDTAQFLFEVVNHPIITLRSEHGFLGVKTGSTIVECNRSQYDAFKLTCTAGAYTIQDAKSNSWTAEGNAIQCKPGNGNQFFFEFRAHSRICITAPNGEYMKCDHSGSFTSNGGRQVKSDTLLEF